MISTSNPIGNAGGGGRFAKNLLFFGDNLKILREQISDESVDLIYLDPLFNSKADYNIRLYA